MGDKIAVLIDGKTITGTLTTDHAASSYGQPVFVSDGGEAIDKWQIVRVVPNELPYILDPDWQDPQ